MRTLAATFSTRNEAEAASGRLQAIGIPGERIILKDVAEAAAGTADADSAGVFVSVKVTTDQVEPVSRILKESSRTTDTAASAPSGGDPAQYSPAAAPPELPPRIATASMAESTRSTPAPALAPDALRPPPAAIVIEEPARAPAGGEARAARPSSATRAADQARFRRYFIYYGFALVAAFMIGAWLGMLG